MSDYSKEHTKKKPVKSYGGQQSSTPMAGTGATPSHKTHDKTISLGEGLAMGSVHASHTKEKAHEAKHNMAPVKASQAMREKAISGNAGTTGGSMPASQKTGFGGLSSGIGNTKVRNKAKGFNDRSISGNADPSAFAGE